MSGGESNRRAELPTDVRPLANTSGGSEQQEVFDSAEFAEKLRRLSVKDQKAKNSRSVWIRSGKEYSYHPNTSEGCIAAVADEMRKHPDRATQIAVTVNAFLVKSSGTDLIEKPGGAKESSDKLHRLWHWEERRGNFWQRVAIIAIVSGKNPESGAAKTVEEAGLNTAAKVKAVL